MQNLPVFVALTGAVQVFLSSAIVVRQPSGLKVKTGSPGVVSFTNALKPVKIHDDVSYEVVNKTSIERKGTTDCLCKIGSFWHWRIKSCQAGWLGL
jgi:hypothetical protein